ncbi:BTB POZ domain-containing POB1-like, partial [Paramuricea clavata]
ENKDSAVEKIMENSNARETFEQKDDVEEPRNIVGEEQKLQETTTEYQNEETKSTGKDGESKSSRTTDDENKSIVSKLFVHSQWLAVQSPYFKALFYSGMKETYSKEVVMKIYEHELQAHLTLIEAMYKLDVLNDKDYRLLVQVLVLANKFDVRHVIKKCKYVLLSTTPSLEMCEYCLREMEHLSDMADIYDMLEKFLVKEFTPIDETWTMKKFTELSKAALRLLLGSDNLGSRSENTVFVALMKWVRLNVSWLAHGECDLLDVSRREQLEPKPKKRRLVEDAGPTFSWVIDEKLVKELTQFPGVPIVSNLFWYQGYAMRLELGYMEDLSKCSFYLKIPYLADEACVYASYRAKSNLFRSGTVQTDKRLFTASRSWGYTSLKCNKAQ